MVVIPGPVEFLMGSPITQNDRTTKEIQHKASNRTDDCGFRPHL